MVTALFTHTTTHTRTHTFTSLNREPFGNCSPFEYPVFLISCCVRHSN